MQQVFDFFKGLFDTDKWPPRWHCGKWSDFHGWLYIISDAMIWVAYFMLPYFILNYIRQKRNDLQYSRIYILFASFILLCGATHFLDAAMFWVPMYRLNALIRLITGVVSMATVYYVVKLLPDFFRQKTYNELLLEIERRKDAERRLALANADLEKFAYIASHDLQEPLRKMIVFNQMIEERNKDVFDDRSKELINKTIRSSSRMQRLITDVLSLSKITQDVNFQPANLQDAVSQALEDLEVKISELNATIHVDELPPVLGNLGYLQQLFYNLIGNALKFCAIKPDIYISSTNKDNYVFVTIKDNGIGIEKEYFEKIFLPFQRLNNVADYEGSGIGLSLCFKIAKIHGGDIFVESQVGVGSIFTVKLQIAGQATNTPT